MTEQTNNHRNSIMMRDLVSIEYKGQRVLLSLPETSRYNKHEVEHVIGNYNASIIDIGMLQNTIRDKIYQTEQWEIFIEDVIKNYSIYLEETDNE